MGLCPNGAYYLLKDLDIKYYTNNYLIILDINVIKVQNAMRVRNTSKVICIWRPRRAYSYLNGDKILMRKSLRKISWRKYLCF